MLWRVVLLDQRWAFCTCLFALQQPPCTDCICRVVAGQRRTKLDAGQQSDMIAFAKQDPGVKLRECNKQVRQQACLQSSKSCQNGLKKRVMVHRVCYCVLMSGLLFCLFYYRCTKQQRPYFLAAAVVGVSDVCCTTRQRRGSGLGPAAGQHTSCIGGAVSA